MEVLFGFFTIGVITLLGAMSPGPDFAVIAKNTVFKSRSAGIATALGVITANIFYIVLVLSGLGFVIAKSVLLFSILKYFGAAYLVYLGVKMLLSKSAPVAIEEKVRPIQDISLVIAFREGLLTNLSNPKFMLFLLGIFTQVIGPATSFAVKTGYGIEIPIVAGTWFVTLALILSIAQVRALFSKYLHYIERTMGLVLIGLHFPQFF